MALLISPSSNISMVAGEEYGYTIDLSGELGTKTVLSHTYKLFDSGNNDITSSFGGGSTITDTDLTFGIIALTTGEYAIQFIVTCDNLLPNGITPYEFYINMTLTIT